MKYVKFLIVIILICIIATGCNKDAAEKRRITNKALDYFSSKYNINRSKITIGVNSFYGKDRRCLGSCGENHAYFMYDGNDYEISYDANNDSFGDDYQYENISNDFNKYLSEQIPYAKTIKINGLESDVLKTPAKYTGDIENYIKNIKNTSVSGGSYTNVKIWIEATDSNQAKELHNKYKKELITKLDELNISYCIAFSNREGGNEYSSFYYYTVSNGGINPAFMYWDRVENTSNDYHSTKSCDNKSVDFNGDEIVCR